ncbi:MAG TPA: hypothetical protein VGM78_08870, partial [Ilumatobacteraceae bacterium]
MLRVRNLVAAIFVAASTWIGGGLIPGHSPVALAGANCGYVETNGAITHSSIASFDTNKCATAGLTFAGCKGGASDNSGLCIEFAEYTKSQSGGVGDANLIGPLHYCLPSELGSAKRFALTLSLSQSLAGPLQAGLCRGQGIYRVAPGS